jgi:hypothetical protein
MRLGASLRLPLPVALVAVHEAQDAALRVGHDDGRAAARFLERLRTGQHAPAGGRDARGDRIQVGAAATLKVTLRTSGWRCGAGTGCGGSCRRRAGRRRRGLRDGLEVPGAVIEAFGRIEVGDADGDAAQLAGGDAGMGTPYALKRRRAGNEPEEARRVMGDEPRAHLRVGTAAAMLATGCASWKAKG